MYKRQLLSFIGIDGIIWFLRTPEELKGLMHEYLIVIFAGLTAISVSYTHLDVYKRQVHTSHDKLRMRPLPSGQMPGEARKRSFVLPADSAYILR